MRRPEIDRIHYEYYYYIRLNIGELIRIYRSFINEREIDLGSDKITSFIELRNSISYLTDDYLHIFFLRLIFLRWTLHVSLNLKIDLRPPTLVSAWIASVFGNIKYISRLTHRNTAVGHFPHVSFFVFIKSHGIHCMVLLTNSIKPLKLYYKTYN